MGQLKIRFSEQIDTPDVKRDQPFRVGLAIRKLDTSSSLLPQLNCPAISSTCYSWLAPHVVQPVSLKSFHWIHFKRFFLKARGPHSAHCSKSAHFGKNISVTFSMTTKGTCWVLAKTGTERSVDDFVSLRTAMKYYDNLAKRKRRLKKKVKVPLVVIFLLIFYSCSGTVWPLKIAV